MAYESKCPIILSFTNKAYENVRQCLSNMGVAENTICHTFDSYFCYFNGRSTGNLKGCHVFVEEFSTKLYEGCQQHGYTVYLFGDLNQCSPVEGSSAVHYDYTNSASCPNTVEMEQIPQSCRYDQATNKIPSTFLPMGKVNQYFEPSNPLYKNICMLSIIKARIAVML